MTKHVMLDLETYSIKPNGMIISIGAVKFDGVEPVSAASDSFHVGIVPASMSLTSFDVDMSTIAWWMDPKQDDARNAWLDLEKTDIASALTAFIMWLNPADPNEYCVWGTGADFDPVLLRSAYEKVLGPGTIPWGYRGVRCFRTMMEIGKACGVKKPSGDFGITHTAIADARWQAAYLQAILVELKLPLV